MQKAELTHAITTLVMQPLGINLMADDRMNLELMKKFGPRSGVIDQSAFRAICRHVLEGRQKAWFPTTLPSKTHSFVRRNPAPVESVYEFGKLLGEGSFGKVYSVTHKVSGEHRVCKKIEKQKGKEGVKMEEILQEIENMALLDHPNVIKVYEYFVDKNSVSQIMEPCAGGELQDKIDTLSRHGKASYDEAFICDVMKQTLRALAFMHNERFMHKDLKPQNIMMVEKDSTCIKVIDFGLAELFEGDRKVSDQFGGTLLYMAPEVFKLEIVQKSDVWSAAVILYNMITGDFPFMATWPLPKGKDMDWWQSEVSRTIQEDRMRPHRRLSDGSVSPKCVDLLGRMLEKDPNKRPDAAKCLEHAWFASFEETPPPFSIGVTQCLEAYASQPELKKAMFLLIAHQITVPALRELRLIFTHFDVENRGALSAETVRVVLQRSGLSPLQVEKMVYALDRDASGRVSWTEFIAAALCISVCHDKKRVASAFALLDSDYDNKISPKDISDVFAHGAVEKIWREGLPRECEKLSPDHPRGPFTRDDFEKYMGGFMKVTPGDALAAVG